MTPKQRKFVQVYAGNGTEAARLAGYAGSDDVLAQVARENLRKPQIAEAIRQRESTEVRAGIATRHDRQAFWSEVMKDVAAEMRDRLRASELLGKSEADFTDKVEHSGTLSLEELVAASMKPPEDE